MQRVTYLTDIPPLPPPQSVNMIENNRTSDETGPKAVIVPSVVPLVVPKQLPAGFQEDIEGGSL